LARRDDLLRPLEAGSTAQFTVAEIDAKGRKVSLSTKALKAALSKVEGLTKSSKKATKKTAKKA
jgi:ribosomal protein S1